VSTTFTLRTSAPCSSFYIKLPRSQTLHESVGCSSSTNPLQQVLRLAPTATSSWNNLAKLWPLYPAITSVDVGDGTTFFWCDDWTTFAPLHLMASSLLSLYVHVSHGASGAVLRRLEPSAPTKALPRSSCRLPDALHPHQLRPPRGQAGHQIHAWH
jgi:hypothetical protein